MLIGTVRKYPTKEAAEEAAWPLRDKASEEGACTLFGHLIDRFVAEEMPKRQSTAASYRSQLTRIRSRWGRESISEMIENPHVIRAWLKGLRTHTGDRDLAARSKGHIKAMMHLLFEFGMGAGIVKIQANPIGVVKLKVSGASVRKPVLISLDQCSALIEDPNLIPLVRVIVQLAMCTGMRASEILGLRWEDIDFEESELHIRRSVVGKHSDAPKTDSSEAPVPMHEDLAALLRWWSSEEPVVNGWVFGSPLTGRPFHRASLAADHLKPAGKRIGIPNLGFHAFRHTYRAMMDDLDLEMEVQMRLMRHSSTAMTREYGKRRMPGKIVRANAKVVEMVMGQRPRIADPFRTQQMGKVG